MKKFFTFALSACMMLCASEAFAQFHVGFGYTRALDNYQYSGLTGQATHNHADMNGVYAGVGVTIPVIGGFAVTPGVYYSYSTNINKNDVLGLVKAESKTKEHNVKGQLDLSYAIDLTDDFGVFVFAGPRYVHGLSSKTVYTVSTSSVSSDNVIDNYEDSYYKKGNFLVGGGVGVEFLNVARFTVGYDYGLSNRYDGSLPITHKVNMVNAGLALLF